MTREVVSFFKAPPARGKVRYQQARAEVQERSHSRCEARIPEVCRGWGDQAHHVLRRSQGGADDPSNLVWICHACHTHAHANVAEAVELGLIRLRRDPLSSAVLTVEKVDR